MTGIRFLYAMNRFLLLTVVSLLSLSANAGDINMIREALEKSSVSQVQEKVYIHTDNTCYFVGDTLWYKAYVVRSDNNRFTDMSRLLYVELLTPDGLLVERQTLIISNKGYTNGNFTLRDSLYSGYYELRAYTRWQLNFNVREHMYEKWDAWAFYNNQMAKDYFRVWDGLYSRVIPVYSKPEAAGDFTYKRIAKRPTQRVRPVKKENLIARFFPEGGHLIEGVENNVAFELVDQLGAAVDISGKLVVDGVEKDIKTDYMGRGTFTVTPSSARQKAMFTWHGKNYSFQLPKVEKSGVAMRLDDGKIVITPKGLTDSRQYAVSFISRGVLKAFMPVSLNTVATVAVPTDSLPDGVCESTIFDDEGQILASRLFFVNNGNAPSSQLKIESGSKLTYDPYEKISLDMKLDGIESPTVFSVAVRDTRTDEPTYDDGNILTELLLSSELKGFVAHPAYYFESNDAVHRQRLDLLMQVQGWRKYSWQQLADTTWKPRYKPETTLTVEGNVYKMLNINPVEPEEISSWREGVGLVGRSMSEPEDLLAESADGEGGEVAETVADFSSIEYGNMNSTNDNVGVDHGKLRREVLVEAEVFMGDAFVGGVQKTNNRGHFIFEIPPFYGSTYLNMKAYNEKDSLTKSMESRKDTKVLREDEYPDYYVKRDLFYPIFTSPYGYYQDHQPEVNYEELIDTLSDFSMENDVHQLGNVNVKGKRRGKRSIDWNKPAFVLDAYDMYNNITDYGLSFGIYDMRQFPIQITRFLFGNLNRHQTSNIDGRFEKYVYYRNYSNLIGGAGAEAEASAQIIAPKTPQYIYNNIRLKRLKDIRVFTDFEPRNEDSLMFHSSTSADVTIEMVPIPDEGEQVTFRDRHIFISGFHLPAEFYKPDYSSSTPTEPTDYRRTLYWNPNAVTDEEGRFNATFFNNSKDTRIKISASGITPDGKFIY